MRTCQRLGGAIMHTRISGVLAAALALAVPARAQERAMIMTSAGITTTSDTTSGAMNLDYGVRVAKDIVIFGGAGRLINVEPSVGQQAVDTTVSTLAASNVAV